MFQVPGALLWCQWWKNGVAMTRSSGPRRSLVLQWVNSPCIRFSAKCVATVGTEKPSTRTGNADDTRARTASTG